LVGGPTLVGTLARMNQELDATTLSPLLERLAVLDSAKPAEWGKMEAAQMLAHCKVALEIAVGERTLKRGLIGFLFGRMARRSVLKDGPFARGMPTAPIFKVTGSREFDEERAHLIRLLQSYVERGPEALPPEHPFFGAMSPSDWGVLQWKHMDHHLRQFGA
jgi:hypothetical protein